MPIYLSPGLVITPDDEFPNTYPLIGWHNQVALGNIVAASESASFPVTNLANPLTSSLWRSESLAEQLVTISDLDGQTDYVAIARHNFGSADVAVVVEGITAEPGAAWETLAEVNPGDDTPLMIVFAAGHYTDIRLRLTPDDVAPVAGVLYVGRTLRMMRGVQPGYVPMRDAAVIDIVEGLSESGEFLGAIITGQARQSAAQFKALDRAWYNANVRPFVLAANRRTPFFFAWNPGEYPDDVGFVWFDGNVRPDPAYLSGPVDLTLPLKGVAL